MNAFKTYLPKEPITVKAAEFRGASKREGISLYYADVDGDWICRKCGKPDAEHGRLAIDPEDGDTSLICPGEMIIIDQCGKRSHMTREEFDTKYKLAE